MATKVYYNGVKQFKINANYKDAEREFEVKIDSATANYCYQPCVMYFADGTGQPEYEELDDIEFEIEYIDTDDEDFDGIDLNNLYDTDKEFKETIDEAVSDYLYNESDWLKDEKEYEEDLW